MLSSCLPRLPSASRFLVFCPRSASILPSFNPAVAYRFSPSIHRCRPSASLPFLSSASPSNRPIPHGHVLKPFLLADIGEGITACEIVKWLVEPNQEVAEFDPVCEVQSDKATVEITSPFEGTIHRLFGATGELIKVGQPLCDIIVKPDEAEPVSPPEPKPSILEEPNAKRPSTDVSELRHESEPLQVNRSGPVHSTPAVRRLAKEHQVDIGTIKGTGKEQRVTKEDLLNHLSNTAATLPTFSSQSSSASSTSSETVRVPFSAVRQAMFRSMSQSLKIPHFGYSEQIDVTALERVRQELNSNPGETRRLTLFSFLIKAIGHALRSEPVFRSTLTDSACFLQRQSVDISIAFSSPHGLLTPLIPNVEQKTVYEIADHLTRLRQFLDTAAIGDRVPAFPQELGGNRAGTLTLSNIGVIGGTYTFPVIPPTGQLAIGAFGKVQVQPGYPPGPILTAAAAAARGASGPAPAHEPRMILHASFSADHRAVEGVELASLVQRFKEICEQPSNLIGLGI